MGANARCLKSKESVQTQTSLEPESAVVSPPLGVTTNPEQTRFPVGRKQAQLRLVKSVPTQGHLQR